MEKTDFYDVSASFIYEEEQSNSVSEEVRAVFSCNGRISEKQLQKMFVSSVFAGLIFVIPYLSARLFGKSLVTGLFLFFVLGGLYLLFFYGVGEHYEIGNNKWFLSLRVTRLIVRLSFYIVLAVAVLGEGSVPFMEGKEADKVSNLLVVMPLLLLAFYGANTAKRGGNAVIKEAKQCLDTGMIKEEKQQYLDIEKQGRIREMIFGIVLIPFTLMILFGLKEVDYSVFVPQFSMPIGKTMLCAYSLLAFLLPAENYLYARTFLRKKGSKKIISSALATFLLVLLLALFLLGIYGVNGAGQEEMVTIAIMRYIRLPFGVVQRFDMLMVWFFMAGCFVLICETLYYAGYLLSLAWEGIKRIWLLIFILCMALLIVWVLPDYKETVISFMRYGAMFDVPVSIILPIAEMVVVEKNGRG